MLSGGFSAEALKEVKHIPKTRFVSDNIFNVLSVVPCFIPVF